jgi:phage-related minor tail protein
MSSYRTGVSVLEDGLAKIKKEWQNLIDRINGLLARVQHELNSDSIWASISEWFTDKIKDAVEQVHRLVEEIGKKVGQILDAVQKAVSGSVPVGSLFEVGLDWASKVNPPLSDMSPDMTGSGKIDSWRGPAKLTYEKRVADQIDAVDSTVGKVKATSAWLADVAQANTAYMVQLGERAAEVVGALVAVVIDGTETAGGAITQIVITLQHLSEFVGTCVTQILQYVLNLANRLAEVLKQITTLAGEYGDHTGLPGGKWPQPVNA